MKKNNFPRLRKTLHTVILLLTVVTTLNISTSISLVKAQASQFLYAPFLFPVGNSGYYMDIMTSVFDHSKPNYSKSDNQIIMFNTGVFKDDCISFDYKNNFVGNCMGPIQTYRDNLDEFDERVYYNGHDGYDWDVPDGEDILAAASGVVDFVGWWPSGSLSCLGYMVIINHQNDYRTIYGHLLNNSSPLHVGNSISVGQKIGKVGNTTSCGTSTGSHLHFSVEHYQWQNEQWYLTDPFGWASLSEDPLVYFNGEWSRNLWVGDAPRPFSFSGTAVSPGVPNNGHFFGGSLIIDYTPPNTTDNVLPTGYWINPSNGQAISSSTVTLNINATDNAGGSGVREVRWQAKYNGAWHGIGTDYDAPYSTTWDWCAAGVQNGDVELGLEVLDNVNPLPWVYSEHAPAGNIHINKNYTCDGGSNGSISWSPRFYNGMDHWWDPNTTGNQMCAPNSFNQGNLDQNYYGNSPCGGGATDNWVGDYKATVNFLPGNYAFWVDHDDWLKLRVDGREIYSVNGVHSEWKCVDNGYLYLSGNHNIWAILAEQGGDARIKVEWSKNNGVCDLPAAFNKSSPLNGLGGQSINPTLSWGVAGGAKSYSYCVVTAADNALCDSNGRNVDSATSVNLSGLNPGTTYYWKVKAYSQGGAGTEADNGAWWSFTTQGNGPSAFGKITPTNGDNTPPTNPTLSWTASNGASWYQYCYDTTDDGICDNDMWHSAGTDTNAYLTGLIENTTYYWQVRTSNSNGTTYADGNTWWSFAPSFPTFNFLTNPGFESGSNNLPSSWLTGAWTPSYSAFEWSTAVAHSGNSSLKIVNNTANDARWIQTVTVQPNSTYRLSGWIMTNAVAHPAEWEDVGANLSILDGSHRYTSPKLFGDNPWTFVSLDFNSGSAEQVTIAARLGMYSGTTTGTAWFDDLKLELLSAPICYNLTRNISPVGSGSITVNPSPNCNNGTQYIHGTVVSLTATPDTGYSFTSWNYQNIYNVNPANITMTWQSTVTAYFTLEPTYALTVSKTGTGTGMVTSNPAGISCGATCSANFNNNTSVTLTAAPATGSTFTGWSGACTGTGVCTVATNAVKSVTANFTLNTYALAISKVGAGSGVITSNPAGIYCGSACSYSYNYNTSVTLTAAPATGSTFTGWSGGGCSGTGTCTAMMTTTASITANFTLNTYTLSISKSGAGSGTVTSSPVGINCGSTCLYPYNYNTAVTLSATPSTGSTFTGWSGGGCAGAGICTVTMTTAASVTANFILNTYTLSISRSGTGSGTVTSSPTGVNCGSTCSYSYNYNTAVTLTAAPATGSTFTGWSGGGCSGTGICAVTMTTAASVTANFTLNIYLLSVSKAGTGSGAVISSPIGINCGSTCSNSYYYNTAVALTVTSSTGSTFIGWSGACTGMNTTCTVTMDAAKSATANFILNTYTLNVNKSGTGSGLVSSSPVGVTCGADCWETYNYNASVTLTATPDISSTFTGWSGGGCFGSGTCIVTMSNAQSVTATFTLKTYSLSINKSGTGSGTVTSNPTGINCGSTCSNAYNYNTLVTLTATPSTGSIFTGWSGGGCSGAETCTATMTAAIFVTSNFESLPSAFSKSTPINLLANVSLIPTLSWTSSSNAVRYEYCLDTVLNNLCANDDWVNTATNTSVMLGELPENTTYEWQVRAINTFGTTVSNTGMWYSFTTGLRPLVFTKTSPSDSATFQPVSLTISWAASTGATSYKYCYNTSPACSSWNGNTTNLSAAISGLNYDTTYYWHVRAFNAIGDTYSDGNAWHSFVTGHLPSAFKKSTPADGATSVAINPTLIWDTSADATSYEYCLSVTSAGCATWTSVGNQTSAAPVTLLPGTKYYWNVRAKNNVDLANSTSALDGIHSFTTGAIPDAFNKSLPENLSPLLSKNVTLKWGESTNAVSYEYCINTTSTCQNNGWINVGANTDVDLTGTLSANTTYYWQVRAVNAYGTRNATTNAWWVFRTMPIPAAFNKISPISTINVSLAPVLSWTSGANVDKYEYCIDTVNVNPCASWIDNGISTSKSLSGLSLGTTYYWQVRATNTFGITHANGNMTAYGSFTTGNVPASFNKISPINGATEQPLAGLMLRWGSSNGVTPTTSYEYCYDTTDDDTCTTWIDNGMVTSKTLGNLSPLTIHYWHVRAKNQFGITYANNNEWWAFITKPLQINPFPSAALNDGWTLESSEFSNLASTKNNSGTLRVGDDARNKQYRSLLYFDTANLPNNAVITKVTVQIKKASVIGDPFATLGNLVADMKKGYFGLSPLELSDFQAAAAPINTAGKFTSIGSDWYQLNLSPVNFKYVTLFGTTQFRLRFIKDDDNDKKADFTSFYAGDELNEDWKPILNVEYWIP